MGYDATNHIDKSVSKEKLVGFIKLLGFEKQGEWFHFYKRDEYKYLYGVGLYLSSTETEWLVHTRTPIYCSDDDLKYQNYVIKKIRQYFGGYFVSDNGKNRYFSVDNVETTAAERGCYAAHFRLSDQLGKIAFLVNNYDEPENVRDVFKMSGLASPSTLLSNIATTYISSIIESYFRNLYVALLAYSPKKENILSSARIISNDYIDIAKGKISIEEAVALSMSFQNIGKIDSYFKTLDKRISIYGVLSKPYRRRKETLFETLNRVLEHRHGMVHRMGVDILYSKENVLKDIDSVKVALNRAYEHICDVYDWSTK